MKILLSICVVCLCGEIGLYIKFKIKNEIVTLNIIKKYAEYCYNNIIIFKSDLISTTKKYIISEKDKNAKFSKIFLNNDKKLKINKNFIKNVISNSNDADIVISYFEQLSIQDYKTIEERFKNFSNFLNLKIKLLNDKLKGDGELYFKISLAIGAILSIIMW